MGQTVQFQILKLFILVGWDRSSFICCLVHRSSSDDLLLLQISSGVVWQTRDLHLSRNTYLLNPRLCFFIVLKRDLFVLAVRVSVTFHLTCVHIIFSSVWVAKWPPFGKYVPTQLTKCSLCILTISNLSYFPLWFWFFCAGYSKIFGRLNLF